MRRFFSFMMTLSLVSAVAMPFSSVSSFAETTEASVSSTSELSETGDESDSSGSTYDSDTDDTNDSSGTETDKGNKDSNKNKDDKDGENSKDSKSDNPSVIQSDNESGPDNPIGDDSSYYNVSNLGDDAPDISAESAILMDASTGAVLYGVEADAKRYPASITKTMTALLVVENCDMDDIVTFSNEAVNGVEAGSSSAGINVGAQLTVEDTLYAMMLVSANEAAAALAEHVAGSVDAFADMMNARAEELGCTKTHFVNPHGLPDENHYTTAHDMGLILKQAMKYEEFRRAAETITYTLEESDTLPANLELWNHAKILRKNSEYYYEYAEGAKTGFTQAALNTLVTYARKDDTELLCVILKDYGAASSYEDTTALFKWGFEKVKGITPLSDTDLKSVLSSSKDIDDSKKKSILSLKTSFNKDYYILVPQDFKTTGLKTSFELDEDKKAKRLGYITVSSGKEVIGKTPVTYEGSSGESVVSSSDSDKPVAGNEDGLETAPDSETAMTPHKLLSYLLRVVIAVVLVGVIMTVIRIIINSRKPRKDFGRRNKARTRSQSRVKK